MDETKTYAEILIEIATPIMVATISAQMRSEAVYGPDCLLRSDELEQHALAAVEAARKLQRAAMDAAR